jgi:FAD/FMN-containing dehydrogenase/Fe-S oxidoreductase
VLMPDATRCLGITGFIKAGALCEAYRIPMSSHCAMISNQATRTAPELDAAAMARELQTHVDGEVRFNPGDRALYATDASNYRQAPIGVVVPRSKEALVTTVEICRRFGAPITSRGAGTSLAGQCCNVAVIVDVSKHLDRILELDPERKIARMEPGVILDQLRDEAKKFNLTFGSDTSTHAWATIGGSLGNNACGVHSLMSGRASDNVEALEILTYDGLRLNVGPTPDEDYLQRLSKGGREADIFSRLRQLRDQYAELIRQRYPRIPRRVSGYNLDDLLPENGFHAARSLIGTEGTCVTYLEATMRLVDSPPCRVLAVLGYPDIYLAADHIPDVLQYKPLGLEAIDDVLTRDIKLKKLHAEHLRLLPEGKGWLVAEFGGYSMEEARARAEKVTTGSKGGAISALLYEEAAPQRIIWEIRESALGSTARIPNREDTWEGWEDSAVAPEKLGHYLRDLRRLLEDFKYFGPFYGHFGQGCVHTRINFGLKNAEGIRKFRAFLEEATDLVVRYGGSFSGEHGDGQSKAEFLPKMYGPELVRAFSEFKEIWDPDNKMNPGKVVRPFKVDENLRLGPGYEPEERPTEFHYPEDGGSFVYAMERCVGVGKCRRTEAGTMCPSFMVTREEKHSTRGRARLLHEMLRGEVIGKNGWMEEAVKESLDLCLACKACKSECPLNVDMATYKAEFRSHYYRGRLRPRAAYAMGLIFWWARIGSLMPKLSNFTMRAPLFKNAAKWLGGIASERDMPQFAEQNFRNWFARQGYRPAGRRRVLLWPDTFNNFFHPQTAMAAAEVLRAAGFDVVLPEKVLCCGRPLYDFGMLDLARVKLEQILECLRPEIHSGTPVVVLEPSCLAVFRDEMLNLFPKDEGAKRLAAQSCSLSEFLLEHAADYPLPRLERDAIVHLHCHHRAVLGLENEQRIFSRLGLKADILDSGCCGMAGAFGFEKESYEVSVACAERVLLKRIRETPAETLLIADGFSCRQQIEQLDGRRALHLAEVLKMAHREGPRGPAYGAPENYYLPLAKPAPKLSSSLLAIGGVIAASGALWWGARQVNRGKRNERETVE